MKKKSITIFILLTFLIYTNLISAPYDVPKQQEEKKNSKKLSNSKKWALVGASILAAVGGMICINKNKNKAPSTPQVGETTANTSTCQVGVEKNTTK